MLIPKFNSNTTLVKVKLKIFLMLLKWYGNSNTTLVKVKYLVPSLNKFIYTNSNTTLVKVKSFVQLSHGCPSEIQIQLLLKLNINVWHGDKE